MRHYLLNSVLFLLTSLLTGQGFAATTEYELLQQLRADYVVLLQARTEFEQTYQNRNSGSNAEDDHLAWIRQLSDRVAQGCQQLSIVSTEPLPADLPCTQIFAGQSAPAAINITTESTAVESTARMIEQFNGSLGEFDERLLREQDRIKQRKPRTEASSSASGGGASAGQGGVAGENDGDEGKPTNSGSEKTASESGTAGSVEEGKPGSSSKKGSQGKSLPGSKSSAPDDIPDGSNDDVVARQLREAAEKETDPELKKRLWDEYRRYKSGEL